MDEPTSEFVGKEPCPACGSRDNLARYSDGHGHCFGCQHREPATEGEYVPTTRRRPTMSEDLLEAGEYASIKNRGISEETCRKYGYTQGQTSAGKKCHIAAYRDQEGNIVAQHLRMGGKQFPWIGDKKKLQLFGQHIFRDNCTKVIITEGEIDAMSVYEALDMKRSRFGIVSIASGAHNAKKDLAENLAWLEGAEEIILMFDMDEPGQEAAAECARIFKPGKCKIAKLPLKDANDMLRSGRGPELIDAIFSAKGWRPEGIVKISDVYQQVMTAPTMGLPWFLDELNKDNFGRQYGELVGLGAGTGVGKTDLITQQVEFDLTTLDIGVGIFWLEQQPYESVKRLAGKHAGKRFHIPAEECDPPWTQEDLEGAVRSLDRSSNLHMYDHFGVADYDRIEDTIRHLYHAEGVRVFYIDHLTALAAMADSEKDELERIMAKLGGLVKELDIWVLYISHLTTPEGKPHEEGGRVMIRHFKGSRSIGFWTHRMYGLERNQQADDEDERTTTTLRTLKDRPVGSANGKTYPLGYEEETGRLFFKGWSSFGDASDAEPF